MSVRVVADGADGYRLLSANNELVGWVRGRAIGVAGFADDRAATSAVLRAYPALAAWLDRQHLHPLAELTDDAPRLVHDGAHRWLLVGSVPVARLPTGTPYASGTETHAFEIVLKGEISEGMMIHAALVALRESHGSIDAADIVWSKRRSAIGTDPRLALTTHLDLDAW